MASAIIHLAIAKELEETLNIKNKYNYYLGSIAPDIAKQVGITKEESHFIKNTYNNVPNLAIFTDKYPNFFKNEFELGYYIHLLTDKLWVEEYLNNHSLNSSITLLDGSTMETTKDELQKILYSDYTNLNIQLIEDYDLDLSLFYEDFKEPETDITEIPVDKLDILINKMSIIIENSKQEKTYLLDAFSIKQFITNTVEEIEKELRKYS